jgi:beta-lactamase regulating signal transducer with metallopeptidase domain
MTWLVGTACSALFEMDRASRLVSNLYRLGAWDARLGAQVLTTDRPVCLLSGALTPTVLVSRGFLASVTESELDIALHHERAHARRRDILWRLVARVATVFIWSKPRAQLLRALDLAAERSCDEAAATQIGSRLQVAETILKVERLLHVPTQLVPAVAFFGGESVPARVEALLRPPMRGGNMLPWVSSFTLLLLLIVTVNHPIHHFAESFIELLAH